MRWEEMDMLDVELGLERKEKAVVGNEQYYKVKEWLLCFIVICF